MGLRIWYGLDSHLCPCGPGPWSPDISLDAHATVLEARVHSEVNGVGGFPAVVLMDQHRVLCDVMACSIPGKQNMAEDACLHVTSTPNTMVAGVSRGT